MHVSIAIRYNTCHESQAMASGPHHPHLSGPPQGGRSGEVGLTPLTHTSEFSPTQRVNNHPTAVRFFDALYENAVIHQMAKRLRILG